jgi:hypothetical protein
MIKGFLPVFREIRFKALSLKGSAVERGLDCLFSLKGDEHPKFRRR